MSNVAVTFGAQDTNLSATLNKINSDMGRMRESTQNAEKQIGSSFGGMVKAGAVLGAGIAVLGAAFRAARATAESFGAALDLGGRLSELKSQTGESAGNLMVLERAFENTGIGAQNVGSSINKLQRFMAEAATGGESQIDVMNRMGLSMSDLEGKTPTEQMRVFADHIASIESPTERAAIAMEIFGRSGGKMLPLLMSFSQELDGAKGELGSMPAIMDKSSEAFDTLSDKLAVIKGKAVEVAAGFLEDALPALNAFAEQIAGVDAAGWGKRMMESILRVSDTLAGAFINSGVAVDTIGLALEAYAKGFGNVLLNGIITAGNFLKNYFTSDIPLLIVTQIGSAMSNAFAVSLRFLSAQLDLVARALDSDLGLSFENATKFLMKKFKDIVSFFASDFYKAITSPLDFLAGKIGSALASGAQEGGITFKSVFSDGISTSVKKLSDGLSITADQYSADMSDGTRKIADEFGKIISNTELSAKDFFGAAPAAEKLNENLKEMEESGKKWREQVTSASENVKNDMQDAATATDAIPVAMSKAETSAKVIKEDLSLAAKLMGQITGARAKDKIDPGGRLEKRAGDALARGDFGAAERAAKRIERREEDREIQDAFNPDKAFGKSIQDLAKEQGIDTFGKTRGQLRKELRDKARAEKKGEAGEADEKGKGKDDKGKDDKPAENPLVKLVTEIKAVLEKLEKKLPQTALAN